jgi:hypothetical protein
MFIVLVWDEKYIAQLSEPSAAEAPRKAKQLLSEGRRNVFIRDLDRNQHQPEHFERRYCAKGSAPDCVSFT